MIRKKTTFRVLSLILILKYFFFGFFSPFEKTIGKNWGII